MKNYLPLLALVILVGFASATKWSPYRYTPPRSQPTRYQPKTNYYHLTFSFIEGAPDGFSRRIVAVNGQYPGPLLEGNRGDHISIDVTNHLDRSLSIHWHGMIQNGTQNMDGAAFITECPVPPGETRTYFFYLQHHGTYWYHGHFMNEVVDGCKGSFIIHRPPGEAEPYDYKSEALLELTDWYHREGDELWLRVLNPPPNARPGPPTPNSVLINGVGQLAHCYNGEGECLYSVVEAAVDGFTRIRIVSTSSFLPIIVSIDNHVMVIIEVDGVDTVWRNSGPNEINSGHFTGYVSHLRINVAQRYSVIAVPMNNYKPKEGDKFWIRAVLDNGQFAGGASTGLGGVSPTYGGYQGLFSTPDSAAKVDQALLENPVQNILAPSDLPQFTTHLEGPAYQGPNYNMKKRALESEEQFNQRRETLGYTYNAKSSGKQSHPSQQNHGRQSHPNQTVRQSNENKGRQSPVRQSPVKQNPATQQHSGRVNQQSPVRQSPVKQNPATQQHTGRVNHQNGRSEQWNKNANSFNYEDSYYGSQQFVVNPQRLFPNHTIRAAPRNGPVTPVEFDEDTPEQFVLISLGILSYGRSTGLPNTHDHNYDTALTLSSVPCPECLPCNDLHPLEYMPVPRPNKIMNLEIEFFRDPKGVGHFNNESCVVHNQGITSIDRVRSKLGLHPDCLSYTVEANDVVLIIMNSRHVAEHPIHLHGHLFWVLSQGEPNAGDYDPDNPNLPEWNWETPLYRDTVTINALSYVILAFVADNPGLWIFHCHIDWHMMAGLSMIINERPNEVRSGLGPLKSPEVCQYVPPPLIAHVL